MSDFMLTKIRCPGYESACHQLHDEVVCHEFHTKSEVTPMKVLFRDEKYISETIEILSH